MRWALCICVAHAASAASTQECTDRAIDLVNSMTVNQLIGQMTQLAITEILNPDFSLNEDKVKAFAKLGVGSYLNSPFAGGPNQNKFGWNATEWRAIIGRIQEIHMQVDGHPILFGLDSVHGANYVSGAVMFPHQINAAAAFNRDLVRQMGYYTGRDTEAAGIPWIFGPILDVVSHKAWARVYETFGEDPYLVTEMASQIVHGLQDNNTIAACFKHFIGYAATPTGHDRDPITLSDYEVLNYYMPPFKAAIEAGAMTGMMNYVSLNGVPMGVNHKMLNDLLRDDLRFKGMLVTDWGVIDDLHLFHKVAATPEEAVELSLTQTSIDMSMVATNTAFIDYARALYDTGVLSLDRLRRSARRIVALKLQLGLYETQVPGQANVALVGDPASRATAAHLAAQSIVLLTNRNRTLPLSSTAKVFLTGPSMDNIGHLCGGWSLAWQGIAGNTMYPHGRSVLSALNATFANVQSFQGVSIDGQYSPADLATASAMAAQAEYTVVVLGEAPYAEKPGDIMDLSLADGQVAYVKALAATGTKVVLVLVQGRPRLLRGLADVAHAVINAMLPCEMGGDAIAKVLTGAVNPSGKLPYTYPKHQSEVASTYMHRANSGCNTNGVFGDCKPEFAFGTGLSYSTFVYSNVRVRVMSARHVAVSLTLTNKGPFNGYETILIFVRQLARRHNVPEAKRLVYFDKVFVVAGTTLDVVVPLDASDWASYTNPIGRGLSRTPPRGKFQLLVTANADCTANVAGLCVSFQPEVVANTTATVTAQVMSHVSSMARYRHGTPVLN